MPGILGVFDNRLSEYNIPFISETLDLLSLGKTETLKLSNGFISISALKNTPLKGRRYFISGKKTYCLAGDIVGPDEVPWHAIEEIIETEKYERFKDFQGNFAISCFDEEKQHISIVSDRRSQYPIFYKKSKTSFVFSTNLATFCRLKEQPEFNEKWLYEFFFFNFPVLQTTFLKSSIRMPPASILQYNFKSSNFFIKKYANLFKRKESLIKGDESFKYANKIVRSRVPIYYNGIEHVACALTDGWDARTILVLSPCLDDVTSYTYGLLGCFELQEAELAAKELGIPHKKIFFDDSFIKAFPTYMTKAIFLSSGLQTILRTTLLYAYEKLTNCGKEYPLIISGISLDQLLRGPLSTPVPISFDVANMFRGDKIAVKKDFWSNIFQDSFKQFEKHIIDKLYELKNTYGDFTSTEHHLLFKLYEQCPKYFGGELCISENFSTLRVPSWDAEIIDLAFSIEESALFLSPLSEPPVSSQTVARLQARLLCEISPKLAKIAIRNTRPDIVLKSKTTYRAYMLYRILLKKIHETFRNYTPVEDWEFWLNDLHHKYVDELIFSANSMVGKYFSSAFLNTLKYQRDFRLIGKIITVEIILRLIKCRWQTVEV